MSAKYTFRLQSEIANHPLPGKILLAQQAVEPVSRVLLKLLAFVVFQRERLQIETRPPDEDIHLVPALAQLDYTLRPALWIECGETPASRLDKLAVKVPWAEIWTVVESYEELSRLTDEMAKLGLRRDRYRLLAFEGAQFAELMSLLRMRNELNLFSLSLAEGRLQFEFNGLWFEGEFQTATF